MSVILGLGTQVPTDNYVYTHLTTTTEKGFFFDPARRYHMSQSIELDFEPR